MMAGRLSGIVRACSISADITPGKVFGQVRFNSRLYQEALGTSGLSGSCWQASSLAEHLGIRKLDLQRRVHRSSHPDWYLVSVTEQLVGTLDDGVGNRTTASWFRFRNGRPDRKVLLLVGRHGWLRGGLGSAVLTPGGPAGDWTSYGGDMRYPKGSIVLSDSLDVPALRKVYQAGHVTAWQLYRGLNPIYDESKWKSFVRRLGILSERHFLIRLVVDGMSSPVFALGDEGARSLQARLPTLIEAGPRDSQRGNRDHVWHDVELFELQLKLRQSGVVSSWLYEPEIRADNELTSFGYAKDYDAIVTFRCGQKSGKVALEYERSPKSTKQYRRIADILNRETKVTSVLYLVCNVQMESFLLNGLRGTRRQVYVCQAHQFAEHPTEATLVDVAQQVKHRLADCLS